MLFKTERRRAPPRRFVIIGLPRSGTTYLMTYLRSHPRIFCTGEQFNPYAIVGVGGDRDDSFEAVVQDRDTDPVGFMERFFEAHATQNVAWVGFKFMLGHNIDVFRALAEQPDIAIIHVWRENRLAQVASLIKAAQSKRWAQAEVDAHVDEKIRATPRQISHQWHEFATMDLLFQSWLAQAPNPSITLEYRDLFQPEFRPRICDFLRVRDHPRMKSQLVKQGANTIAERFQDGRGIAYYFKRIGYGRWLEDEL